MMYFRSVLVAVLLAASSLPASAQTPGACAKHVDMVDHLATAYGEVIVTTGVTANGRPMQTFANITTGTWTAVVRVSPLISCLLATGTAFKALPAIGGRPA